MKPNRPIIGEMVTWKDFMLPIMLHYEIVKPAFIGSKMQKKINIMKYY